jgi:curved DNA-binding protein CbpA
MTKLHTHYDNLKVSQDAPDFVIKAAYKVLAQRFHPDRDSSPAATRNMQVINDAYATLSDTAKRAAHDQWIAKGTPKSSAAPISESAKIERLRLTHRADLHQLRQVHAIEIEIMKRRMNFDRKFNVLVGLLFSIPLYLIFSNLDNAINKAHAETIPVYQQNGGSHVTSLGQSHGEASWREHTAERTTKPPKTHLGTPKASR